MFAAAQGAGVLVNDIDADVAEQTATEIAAAGGKAIAHAGSIAEWAGAERLVNKAVKEYGRLDGFVNNAAIFHTVEPWEETEESIRGLIEVNVLGTMFCGVLALRQMVKQRSGSLVNITSGAHAGISLMGAYGASKGAVASWTYSTAIDAMRYGVRVNAVSPLAETRMGLNNRTPRNPNIPRWPPERTGPLVTFLLSDLSAGVTGQVVRLDGHRFGIIEHPVWWRFEDRAEWPLEEMAAAFDRSFRSQLRPVGQGVPVYSWAPEAGA
jgi:NAD(P)-dependent dehydrogenase (short-subunit alcohol dehydrogenase family)